MKLLVRNLATSTSKPALEKLFSQHGTIQSCTLVLDEETGESKGFGFITMQHVGESKAAMKALNGMKLHGNIIRVKKAVPKKEEVDTSALHNTEEND